MGSPLQTADDELLGRIRGGDREAVAEFIRGHEPLIRRRFRHKMGAALRRVVDSEDLVSTLSRRLDAYMAMGRLSATTPDQLWALVLRIAERSIFDKLRELQRSPGPGGGVVAETVASPERLGELVDEPGGEWTAEDIMGLIPVGDREIARGWLKGLDYRSIGEQVGMSADRVRQRWHRIKLDLRSQMEGA
jgi:RNA polymerase sigma factor (sigma-70 family)